MSAVELFTYTDTDIRVVMIDGEPWFVLADLCRVLGLARSASAVADRLEDGVRQTYPILDALGREQQAVVVSEAGMYEVVIRSDKPEAVGFRRWITGEVLPQIRKTGQYGVPQLDLSDPIAAIEAANSRSQQAIDIAKAERARAEKAEADAKVLTAAIERDAPLVAKAEAHTVSDSAVHRQEFAREVQTWGLKQNIDIKQLDVMRFLGHIGLFIRGERSDTGHATADAQRRGLAFTHKDTARNGYAYAVGKLTPAGQDYAWGRITKYVAAHGDLQLPRELRAGDSA